MAFVAGSAVVYALMKPRQDALEKRVEIMEDELVRWRVWARETERRISQHEAQLDEIVRQLETLRAQVNENTEVARMLDGLISKAKAKVAQKQRYNANQQSQDRNHVTYIF